MENSFFALDNSFWLFLKLFAELGNISVKLIFAYFSLMGFVGHMFPVIIEFKFADLTEFGLRSLQT